MPSGRPLRVGFVSGDLRNHPVGYFLEGLLAHLDPTQVELLAYTTIARTDDLSRRIRPRFHQWQCIAALDDAAAARRVHADGVDVLIDLAGHTAHNRLGVFAWRPAPVQATWLGYVGGTGVPTIDWRLTDAHVDPVDTDVPGMEKPWRLPQTLWCYQPYDEAPDVSPLPAASSPTLTFACLNNPGKVSPATLAMWSDILRAVPDARLILLTSPDADRVAQLRRYFEQRVARREGDHWRAYYNARHRLP
jgi:predicted O-linked N-acetylglucosamine transferase (SPINDLY family)